MRYVVAFAVVLGIAAGVSRPVVPGLGLAAGPTVVAAQQQPNPPAKPGVNVDINVHRSGGAWWASPTWIAIGVIAFVLLVLIIVLASRGGGTTVIKE